MPIVCGDEIYEMNSPLGKSVASLKKIISARLRYTQCFVFRHPSEGSLFGLWVFGDAAHLINDGLFA